MGIAFQRKSERVESKPRRETNKPYGVRLSTSRKFESILKKRLTEKDKSFGDYVRFLIERDLKESGLIN